MRVIAGTARSIPLQTVKGSKTRPTTDRIKETLFNMISDRIPGAVFLDMFSGSGQIGIEALSRSAKTAVFVDSDRDACRCIQHNLGKTHLSDKARVFCKKADSYINSAGSDSVFDIVYLDPPYDMPDQEALLKAVAESGLLARDGLVILEAKAGYTFDEEAVLPLEAVRIKEYKTNQHIFFQM